MKKRIAFAAVLVIALLTLGLSGCSEEKGTALTTDDTAKLHAAPGQPMPAEAKAFMEKGSQEGQAKAAAVAGTAGASAPKKP